MTSSSPIEDYVGGLLGKTPSDSADSILPSAATTLPPVAPLFSPGPVFKPSPSPNEEHDDPPRVSSALHSSSVHINERSTRWLRLRCDEQTYAIELLKVQEVVLPSALLRLRGSDISMQGIMNLRGQVVPVVDLGMRLGRSPIASTPNTRVVVLEEHGNSLGLRVSAVDDVVNIVPTQIEAPEQTQLGRMAANAFIGVARPNGRTIILLDASQLLLSED